MTDGDKQDETTQDETTHSEAKPANARTASSETAQSSETSQSPGTAHPDEDVSVKTHRWKTILAAILIIVALVWLGRTGVRMGMASVDVTSSEQYRRRDRDLRWASSDLVESHQDVVNRTKDIERAEADITKAKDDAAADQAVVEEFRKAEQPSGNPALTVVSIGERGASAGGYTVIPVMLHNNTQETYGFYDVNFQVQDDAGNVVHTYFALGSSDGGDAPCAPNADCPVEVFDKFDYAGLTIVPTSWSVTVEGGSNSDYGTYGTDAPTRKF